MSKKTNLVAVDRDALVNSTFTDSSILNKAVLERAGESKIEIKQDSDGNDYASATFELKAPAGKRTEVTLTDMELATRIERINKSIALGDVAYFVTAKELERITDTDASSIGFESVENMCTSVFGLAKSTVQNYRRLSKFFINEDYTIKGAIPKDTPISTLNQLLSSVNVSESGEIDISNVERLFTSSIITPYMKQAEVKARLAWLKSQESDKELSEMSAEELQELKTEVQNRPKEDSKKQDSKKQENKNKVVVSDNPQVLVGEILNKVKEITEIAGKLNIDIVMELSAVIEKAQAVIEQEQEQEQESK